MTRDEALAEVKRRQASDPDVSWMAAQRGGEWKVVRIGMPPVPKQTATATKPPPVAPHDDTSAPLQRAAYGSLPGFSG
jgi:hypothetical protein